MAAVIPARQFAENICQRLRDSGYQAYLVGGCVRDILLGREPADYDVSTDATPDRVQQLFPHSIAVGAQFGVIVVLEDDRTENSQQVEVATFRSDVGYTDGRHPDRVVYASSTQEDVKRRDFTINALLLDPATEEVLDYVGGRGDLSAGIIRAIGRAEERFREDKLRMVRGPFPLRDRGANFCGDLETRAGNSPSLSRAVARRANETADGRGGTPRI
jgi:poly(A) polymerase